MIIKRNKKINKDVAVELKKVSKVYSLHHEKPTFIEQIFKPKKKDQFKALDNIDLSIYKGEKVGIIGHNGSGKTTILKIIAQITTPTSGTVLTNGKIVSLIDLTAGFHPDLTGEENIFLNGLLVGMSKEEIQDQYQQIIDFADIGKFIDVPLYSYSDGMRLRLGFSIAIHANPDILVLDEGISAGDANFQKKSKVRIQKMFKEEKTIIIVSHWIDYLKKNCSRVILFSNGMIKEDGECKFVLKKYLNENK